jgi:hypothetical protein
MTSNLGKEIDWWCTGIAGLIAAFIAFVTFAAGGDRGMVMAVWVLAAQLLSRSSLSGRVCGSSCQRNAEGAV